MGTCFAMRKTLIAAASLAASSLLAFGGAGQAQGFGQVTFGAVPAAPAPDAAKPTGHQVDSVTVTGKKSTAVDLGAHEVVCHSEPVLGSMFPKKVCATRGELAERRQNDQDVARKFTSGMLDGSGTQH